MANIKSAEKRHQQSLKRRQRNRSQRSHMRSAIKELRAAVTGGDPKQARELLDPTLKVIDVSARKGVIHANTAARYKSRLSRSVAALEA